jgi:hypothetical protein
MEINKAVNMEGCQLCALLCDDTNPTNWFVSLFESSSNDLLVKFQLLNLWIAFLIACLRIDEWWISSQNHNLENLFVVVQSSNSISSREKKHILGLNFGNISIEAFALTINARNVFFAINFAIANHSLLS